MELTDQGDVLGVEEFYPYGDTAYWTQREGGGYSRKRQAGGDRGTQG